MSRPVVLTLVLLITSPGCTDGKGERLREENKQLRGQIAAHQAEIRELKSGAGYLLNSAQVAANEERYAEAETQLRELLQKHPVSSEAVAAKELLARIERALREKRAEEEHLRKAEEARLEETRRKEARRRAIAAASMAKKVDKLEGITWYQDKATHGYESSFHLYFAERAGYVTNLRLKLRYYADDWLFVQSFTVYADGQRFEYSNVEFERDHGSGSIWEWYDQPVSTSDLAMIRAVIVAKDVTVRYHGRQYRGDRKVTSSQRAALQRVLDAYEALGGTLP
jgi:hypothetical protein